MLEIQGLFKDFCHNSRTSVTTQGLNCHGFTPIQGMCSQIHGFLILYQLSKQTHTMTIHFRQNFLQLFGINGTILKSDSTRKHRKYL